jgi:hypothetical protein
MKLRIRDTSLTTRTLGWIQIIGGIYGVGVVSWLTINLGEVNGAILFIVLTGYSLFAFSITSGIRLLIKRTLKLGLILSIINHSLQIFQFKLLGYALTFTSGTAFAIGFNEGFEFNFAIISSEFNMAINTDDTEFIFMVNILAIFIIAVLLDIWNELYNQPKKAQIIEGIE